MADAPAPSGNKSSLGFLGRKIGPVPIWLIGVAGFGAYWWYTHYGPGSKPAAPVAATAAPRPEIIEVKGQRGARGARGFRGYRGPRGIEPPVFRRPSSSPPRRGNSPPVTAPVQAAAPMTGGDIYGDVPTATPGGQTYDSGDVASAMGAGLAIAG